jgi:hypothetical protein
LHYTAHRRRGTLFSEKALADISHLQHHGRLISYGLVSAGALLTHTKLEVLSHKFPTFINGSTLCTLHAVPQTLPLCRWGGAISESARATLEGAACEPKLAQLEDAAAGQVSISPVQVARVTCVPASLMSFSIMNAEISVGSYSSGVYYYPIPRSHQVSFGSFCVERYVCEL